jgi:hypothetical protein
MPVWFFCFVYLMVFNATFNNISVISWRSILLVKEIGGPGENNRSVASRWQTLSHNVVHLALIEVRTHNISGIGTDCIGSCNSNYHTTTATTSLTKNKENRTNNNSQNTTQKEQTTMYKALHRKLKLLALFYRYSIYSLLFY